MGIESVICACGHGPEYHDIPDDVNEYGGHAGWACSFTDCNCDDWAPESAT